MSGPITPEQAQAWLKWLLPRAGNPPIVAVALKAGYAKKRDGTPRGFLNFINRGAANGPAMRPRLREVEQEFGAKPDAEHPLWPVAAPATNGLLPQTLTRENEK